MKRLAEKPKQQNKTVAKEASEPSENGDIDDILKSIEDAFSGIADAFGEIVKIINKIPKVGFILPDGSYLNSKDYNVITHDEMAEIILKKKKRNESKTRPLTALMKQGYLRFKQDVSADGYNIGFISTETYPTCAQFAKIRDVAEWFGKVRIDIAQNGLSGNYTELSIDTLDADMRKLEALLNKVKPPQPKR